MIEKLADDALDLFLNTTLKNCNGQVQVYSDPQEERYRELADHLHTSVPIELKAAIFHHGLPNSLRAKAAVIQASYGFHLDGTPRDKLVAALQEAYDAEHQSKSTRLQEDLAESSLSHLDELSDLDDTTVPAPITEPKAPGETTSASKRLAEEDVEGMATGSTIKRLKRTKQVNEAAVSTDGETTSATTRSRRKRASTANNNQVLKRDNVKWLARAERLGTNIAIKNEQKEDSKRKALHFLGPPMTASWLSLVGGKTG